MQWDKKTWTSVVIAAIMVLSVISFALTFSAPTEKLKYRNYKFVRTSAGFQTTVNDVKVSFANFPTDLEDLELPEEAKTALQARVLWLSYDPQDEYSQEIADAFYYLDQVLGTVRKQYAQRGLTSSTGYTLPEITCANATAAVPVLMLQSGNETTFSYENNCIIATAATRREVPLLSDRILYQSLGVMT
jgi:hypothetical protein